MQEKTYYYLYKVTNKLDGKIYIGVHKTKNINDNYMGSGVMLRIAIKKYGIENFEKIILEFFNSAEEMFKEEAKVVNTYFLLREDVYNLVEGGNGGSSAGSLGGFKTSDLKIGIHSEEGKKNIKIRANSIEGLKRISDLGKKYHLSASINALSEKSRAKRKETFAKNGHAKGEKNSQFGLMWITDGIESRKIKKDQSIPDGWRKGRKIKNLRGV